MQCYGRKGGDEEGKRGEWGQTQLFKDGRNDGMWHAEGRPMEREASTRPRMENMLEQSAGVDKRGGSRCLGRGWVVAESGGIHCGKAGRVDAGAGGRAAVVVKAKGVPLGSLCSHCSGKHGQQLRVSKLELGREKG